MIKNRLFADSAFAGTVFGGGIVVFGMNPTLILPGLLFVFFRFCRYL